MTRRRSATPKGPSASDPAPAHDVSSRGGERPRASALQETSTWIDPDLRYRMISEAAYALYAARGYQDGYDTDDWLAAEARVDRDLQSGTAPA